MRAGSDIAIHKGLSGDLAAEPVSTLTPCQLMDLARLMFDLEDDFLEVCRDQAPDVLDIYRELTADVGHEAATRYEELFAWYGRCSARRHLAALLPERPVHVSATVRTFLMDFLDTAHELNSTNAYFYSSVFGLYEDTLNDRYGSAHGRRAAIAQIISGFVRKIAHSGGVATETPPPVETVSVAGSATLRSLHAICDEAFAGGSYAFVPGTGSGEAIPAKASMSKGVLE